ncbi:MAG: extracellular solute-binding protein [Propionibacteriales bacterium]|nr:extracellular solute-binding protein [Propionibacteriales bacterium]
MPGCSSRRRHGRRTVLIGLALAALVTAGCADDGTSRAPVQDPGAPSLLSLAVYGPPQVVTAYANIAAAYSSAHPNISVSVEPYPTATAARSAIGEQIAAGTAPDLFLSPVDAVASWEQQKAIREVGTLLLDRDLDFGDGYQRYSLEAFSSDNSLQCMPVDSSPLVVYYNSDLVDPADVNSELEQEVTADTGWSFAQFEVAARTPHPNGAHGLYVEPSLTQLAPFIFSGGGALLDDADTPTRLNLSSGAAKDALAKVLPLFRDPVVNFSRQEIEDVPALQRFERGQLGMMLGFRSLTPELRAVKGLRFDVMPLPKLGSEATVGETSGLCLSAASTQVDLAADFLAYVVGDESMALLAATGYVVPSNNEVAHRDTFLQADQQPAHAEVFTDQVRSIRPLPTLPVWPTVLSAVRPLLSELFYDPLILSVDDRLKAIDDATEPLFAAGSPTPAAK